MEKKCKGCGITLQTFDQNELGYVNDIEMDYCQRCFRMRHYDDHKENDFMPDNIEIINQLNQLDCDFVWIMDIIDLDTSLNSDLAKFYQNRKCSIILNKCDLLPQSINYHRLSKYLLDRIHDLNIQSDIILTRGVNDDFVDNFNKHIIKDKPIVFTGVANVGKSTIINELLGEDVATTNRYPATTITINEIKTDKYHFFDSAGLWIEKSMQAHLTSKDLKVVVPSHRIRTTVFQLEENQTISIAGLVRIDISESKSSTVVVYCANTLNVHRGKLENASKYWRVNYNNLKPKCVNSELKDFKHLSFVHKGKADYFISGLGFVTIVSSHAKIDIYVDNHVSITKREAMI